jgi:hypothetical protein
MQVQPYSLRGTEHATAGDLLLKWMGSLWSAFSEDPEFARQYQRAKSLITAQFSVWYQETVALSDRTAIPVYHRERWWPLTLIEPVRNTGKGAAVQLGGQYRPRIGQQLDSPFVLGSTLQVGAYYPLQGVTTYPLPPTMADVLTVIVDNLANPKTILVRGIDFYVENETLFFLHDTDPLTSGKFPTVTTKDGKQALIWLCDAMLDRHYVQNFAGYVLGVMDLSSEFYKRYLNALWDIYNKGATFTEFSAGVAALLGEPSILNSTETVEHVLVTTERVQVVTDAHVYEVQTTAELRDTIVPGAVLRRGELLTKTLKFYGNLDPTRLTACSEYGDSIRTDVPALLLPAPFFRAPLRYGLGMSWERVQVTSAGPDANGNQRLQFPLYGDPHDVQLFWEDFWAYCERENVPPATYFGEPISLRPTGVFGYYGTIVPLEFFLANFLKANTLLVTVDTDRLSAQGRRAAGNLVLLQDVLPKHTYVFVLERKNLAPETFEEYDEMPMVVDAAPVQDVAGPGYLVRSRMTYEDTVAMRWIPVCV